MSLINDLLRDLEDRRGGNKESSELVDGLSHVQETRPDHTGLPTYVIVLLCVAILLLALVLFVPVVFDTKYTSQQVVQVSDKADKKDVTSNSSPKPDESVTSAGNPGLRLDGGLSVTKARDAKSLTEESKQDTQDTKETKDNKRTLVKLLEVSSTASGASASLTTSRATDYKLYTLDDPHRVVIEIPHGHPDGFQIENADGSLIRSVRQGMHDGYMKLVLDLNRFADVTAKNKERVDDLHVLNFQLVAEKTDSAVDKTAKSDAVSTEDNRDIKQIARQTSDESLTEIKPELAHNRQMQKKPRNESPVTLAEKSFNKGVRQYKQGDFENSVQSLNRAIELDPEHGHARYLLASAYIQQDRTELAMSLLSQSVELLPENHKIKKLYAQILFHIGRQQEAVKVLRTRMPLIDGSAEYHALLAGYLQNMQEHKQAADLYRSLVNIRPDQSIWWMGLGISLEALGKQSEALTAYEEAMQGGKLSNNLKQYVSQRIKLLSSEKRT